MELILNVSPDVPTENKRIYPKKVLEKALEEKIKSDLFVCMDPVELEGDPLIVNFRTIIGKVTEYKYEDNKIILVAIPINFTYFPLRLHCTINGSGTLEKREDENYVVQDDFKLAKITILNGDQQ